MRSPAWHFPQSADLLVDLLVENNIDGVLAFDREYRYTMWNRAMERLSGVSEATVLGRSALEIFPFLWSIGEDAYFAKVLAGQPTEARDRPFSVPQTGREGYFDAQYIPLRDQSGAVFGAVAIIRDVTERRQREIAAEQEGKRDREREPNERRTQRAGGTMHDAAWYRFKTGYEPPGTAAGRCFTTVESSDRRRRVDWVRLVDDESGDILGEYPLHVLERCPEPERGRGK